MGPQTQDPDYQTALDKRIETALSLFKHQQTAQENFKAAQDKQKKYYDQKHAPPAYTVDDFVLLNNARRQQRKGDKLAPRWTGPHEIVEVRDSGVIRLKDIKALANMTRIKPYRQPSSTVPTPDPMPPDHTPDSPNSPSSSSTTDDPEVQFVGHVPGNKDIPFHPVGADWQKVCASAFALRVRSKLQPSTPKTILSSDPPHEMVPIRGDGNCLFRSFSHFLTAAQSDHHLVRKAVVQYMHSNTSVFSNVAGSDDYLSRSVMDKAGVWGTDVEVFAFASMVNTTVYVYCPVGESYQWLPYRPVRDVQPNVQVSAPAAASVYISNINSHFQPVVKV